MPTDLILLVVLRVCWKLPCFPPNRRAWTLAVSCSAFREWEDSVVGRGTRSLRNITPFQGVSQLVEGEGPFMVM